MHSVCVSHLQRSDPSDYFVVVTRIASLKAETAEAGNCRLSRIT